MGNSTCTYEIEKGHTGLEIFLDFYRIFSLSQSPSIDGSSLKHAVNRLVLGQEGYVFGNLACDINWTGCLGNSTALFEWEMKWVCMKKELMSKAERMAPEAHFLKVLTTVF